MSTAVISILRRKPGQKIPRPYSRACSQREAEEIIGRGCTFIWTRLNTDEPVTRRDDAEFFAFSEE